MLWKLLCVYPCSGSLKADRAPQLGASLCMPFKTCTIWGGILGYFATSEPRSGSSCCAGAYDRHPSLSFSLRLQNRCAHYTKFDRVQFKYQSFPASFSVR